MNDDIPENDALWCLLGKARQPEVSPFFSRNVLREIRQAQPPRAPLLRWLAPAAYALLAFGFFLTLDPLARTDPAPSVAVDLIEEFDAVAGLDELLAVEEFTPAHLAGL